MQSIDLYVRYSNSIRALDNVIISEPEKLATFQKKDNLIFRDEGGTFCAHLKTVGKFTALTLSSPLIAMARLVRGAVFFLSGNFERAGLEFIGAFLTKYVAATCLIGSLISTAIYPLSSSTPSLYFYTRFLYAKFEAWVNGIETNSYESISFSKRVSSPFQCAEPIWTTAPCMQPVLEQGYSTKGGLLDPKRMQKLFPDLKIKGLTRESNRIVIESEYQEELNYIGCPGLCERVSTKSDCCCWRMEADMFRLLCCGVGRGKCIPKHNPKDSCGILTCGCCGMTACCCYAKLDGKVTMIHGKVAM